MAKSRQGQSQDTMETRDSSYGDELRVAIYDDEMLPPPAGDYKLILSSQKKDYKLI